MTIMITFDLYINLKKFFVNTSVSIVIIIDLYLKYITLNEVMIYEKPDVAELLI